MIKLRTTLQTSCLILVTGLFVLIQAQETAMTRLAIGTNGAFQLSENWKTAQRVMMHPQKEDFLKTEPGTGVLVGTAGAKTQTMLGANDLILQLEFMVSPNGRAVVYLPGGYPVLLTDSWQNSKIDASSSGSIGNLAPLQNAQKAPGLWQKLRIQLRRASNGNAAQLEQMHLNGVLVQENARLSASTNEDNNNLQLEVSAGKVAFRQIEYQLLQDTKPISLSQMTYQLYKGWAEKPEQLKAENLLKKDTTSILTQEWGAGNQNYAVVYDGQINAREAGVYTFQFAYVGHLTFEIDNKNYLSATYNDFSQIPVVQQITLSKGAHRFKLHYHKAWRSPALGIFVATQGVRPYALHALSSLPEPEPIPVIAVTPNGRAELVRSFVQLENEKNKRTHALSVGSPQGLHYTLDLNSGSLLQFWKGQFADVTEMWFERGEPQLLKPLGLNIATKGQPDVALLNDNATIWPDSVVEMTYRGYRLDPATGNPIVIYRYKDVELTDALAASSNGLTRTFTVGGGASATPLYTRLAAGSSINQVEKGLYEINNQSYYVQLDPKAKPIIRTSNGQQELLLPIIGQIRYTLTW